jgi:hypothetical protein
MGTGGASRLPGFYDLVQPELGNHCSNNFGLHVALFVVLMRGWRNASSVRAAAQRHRRTRPHRSDLPQGWPAHARDA